MQPIRLAIALILLGGLVLLTVQNLSPALPLVILGSTTQALPLAVWIGGAIAAGAATTLILSALSSFARPVRRSAPKRPATAGTGFRTPWTPQTPGQAPRQAAQSGSARAGFGFASTAQAKSNRRDDWDAPPSKDEWDDWEEPAPSTESRAPQPQPEIRDRLDEDWADWDGYGEFQRNDLRRDNSYRDSSYRDSSYRDNSYRDDRSSSDRGSDPIEPPEPYIPRRIDFEAKQEPVTRIQSGSVYSHSYNRAETPADRDADLSNGDRNPGEVYDAEYRVLTPPYRANPEPPLGTPISPPTSTPFDLPIDTLFEDDWDFEEDSLDSLEPDEPTERHDRRPNP
jgi:hypothetical protein